MILTPEPVLPAHAFDGQRFGLTDTAMLPPPALRPGLAAEGFPAVDEDPERPRVVLNTLNVAEAEEILIQKALDGDGEQSHARRRAAGDERAHAAQQAERADRGVAGRRLSAVGCRLSGSCRIWNPA